MISQLSSKPLIDHVNPDEVVARGAAIQAILSMLHEEAASGEKLVDDETRQRFSSLDGGLIHVSDITSHTLGVVLWDEKHLQEYVFPMIRKDDDDSGGGEEFIRNRRCKYAACGR